MRSKNKNEVIQKPSAVLKIILLSASAIIALTLPVVSKENREENRDIPGRLTKDSDDNVTCRPTENGKECIASDCNAPDISTECYENENDQQTTADDKL